jgi:hypothetical protein
MTTAERRQVAIGNLGVMGRRTAALREGAL